MGIDAQRDIWNRSAMAQAGLDALVCRLPENVLLLTTFWPLSSFAFVLYPREGPVTMILPEMDATNVPHGVVDEVISYPMGTIGVPDPYRSVHQHLGDAIRSAGLARARIGHEGSFESVATGHTGAEVFVPSAVTTSLIEAAAPDATHVDATAILHTARARKTPIEIEKLRRANAIATFGLTAFAHYFQPGRTEAEVAAQVEAAIMSQGIGYRGATHVRSWSQLMTGPDSARAYSLHPATSARVIQEGDLGVLELATHADGYWSDLTRTRVAGTVVSRQCQEMYDSLLGAHQAVMTTARPGMTGADIDKLARNVIDERGFGPLFNHPTGHGLGFRYHEPHPLLMPGDTRPIEAGMVSSIEPGIYVEGLGGMRLEENVAFTGDGVEVLSDFSAALTE